MELDSTVTAAIAGAVGWGARAFFGHRTAVARLPVSLSAQLERAWGRIELQDARLEAQDAALNRIETDRARLDVERQKALDRIEVLELERTVNNVQAAEMRGEIERLTARVVELEAENGRLRESLAAHSANCEPHD